MQFHRLRPIFDSSYSWGYPKIKKKTSKLLPSGALSYTVLESLQLTIPRLFTARGERVYSFFLNSTLFSTYTYLFATAWGPLT